MGKICFSVLLTPVIVCCEKQLQVFGV